MFNRKKNQQPEEFDEESDLKPEDIVDDSIDGIDDLEDNEDDFDTIEEKPVPMPMQEGMIRKVKRQEIEEESPKEELNEEIDESKETEISIDERMIEQERLMNRTLRNMESITLRINSLEASLFRIMNY